MFKKSISKFDREYNKFKESFTSINEDGEIGCIAGDASADMQADNISADDSMPIDNMHCNHQCNHPHIEPCHKIPCNDIPCFRRQNIPGITTRALKALYVSPFITTQLVKKKKKKKKKSSKK